MLSGRSSLRRLDHLSRGVLQNVMCLNVISKAKKRSDIGSLGVLEPWWKTDIYVFEGCKLLLPKSDSLVICYLDSGWFFHICLERVDSEFTFKH